MSRAGLSTKIHIVVDGRGLPVRFVLTPDQASDKAAVPALIEGLRLLCAWTAAAIRQFEINPQPVPA